MKDPKDRRATIAHAANGEGKFIRQSGGRGQYGHVIVKIEPNKRGHGTMVICDVAASAIPENYHPPVIDGVREALDGGMVIGNPNVDGCRVVDIVVRVIDGSFHATDSSELAFKLAAIFAVKDATRKAEPIAIE